MAAKFLVTEQESELETAEVKDNTEDLFDAREEPTEEVDNILEAEQEDSKEEVEEKEEVQQETLDPSLQKYSGKSISEVIRMHQEAEKHISRQGNELGDLRGVIDKYVKDGLAETSHKDKDSKPKKDDLDLFEKPEEYIQHSIENSDQARELKEIKQAIRQQDITVKLENNHPDYLTTVNDESFVNWVKDSRVRLELFNRAHTSFDYDSADELLSTWEERQKLINSTSKNEKTNRKQQRKSASTGSATGSGETKSRKLYRRSDIRDLMRDHPERYLELSDEITKAYAEKRVR
jgi:hypothetical protein